MKFTDTSELKGKKIAIVGLGQTGLALTRFLHRHEAEITISDHRSKPELINYINEIDPEVKWTSNLGGHSPEILLKQDLIILSPGVSPQLKIFQYAQSKGVHVTGELEFSSQFVKKPIIAVTGTNGKTTVCDLLDKMLSAQGKNIWSGGNYKKPLSSYFLDPDCDNKDLLVLEVSSFMLEHADTFKPQWIVFTNLSENHLERHRIMEGYINAKRKIFKNVNESIVSVLNADDNAVVELARDPLVQKGRIIYFSRKSFLEPQIMNIGGSIESKGIIKVKTDGETETYDFRDILMKGSFVYENIMAALLVAKQLGVQKEHIIKVASEYKGLAHRLEYVRKVRGAVFYNDSKATNPYAVKKALESFDENVILIMGGKETHLNYTYLSKIIKEKVKLLVLIGECKERINREIGGITETFIIGTFEEAVLIAYQKSRIGDIILLSPGCSSFDIFDSYVERGNFFKEKVNQFS